ncbi:SDR family NAD(P)-dependent oxidoreductase, partial [Pseudomonas paraeruginosa]|uniref:SDR family NAD(P)-dependent oxidoreductase n=1 Tax=Pseudomonas paraeruginosa TaxID=2994495 RepID=UPI003A4C61F3
ICDRPTALALGAAGALVLVHCNRGVDEARAVAAEIRDRGGRADVLVADLASVDGARILAAEVGERARRLDVLVACAGIAQTARLE